MYFLYTSLGSFFGFLHVQKCFIINFNRRFLDLQHLLLGRSNHCLDFYLTLIYNELSSSRWLLRNSLSLCCTVIFLWQEKHTLVGNRNLFMPSNIISSEKITHYNFGYLCTIPVVVFSLPQSSLRFMLLQCYCLSKLGYLLVLDHWL